MVSKPGFVLVTENLGTVTCLKLTFRAVFQTWPGWGHGIWSLGSTGKHDMGTSETDLALGFSSVCSASWTVDTGGGSAPSYFRVCD